MSRLLRPFQARGRKPSAAMIAALAGFATAGLVGVALAGTLTIKVANNAMVTNRSGTTASESIVVTSQGFAVYELTGDSKSHPECTAGNGCFVFWLPVKVSSAKQLSKAAGIRGKLAVWHRDGFFQVMLGGHPLYRFRPDTQRRHATGQGIHSFGGTWHVVKVAGSSSGATTTGGGTTSTMMTSTSTTCLYPPCG